VGLHGDSTLVPNLKQSHEIDAPFDLVLLSVKAYALPEAMDDFVPAVGPRTMILPALNGMRHMDALIERFGETPVLGGVCLVATDLDAEGRIVQIAAFQKLIFGERSGLDTPRLEAAHAALAGAGFEAERSFGIVQAMWEKWVQLACLGAITCLLRGTVGEIVSQPGGAELVLTMLEESAAIARAAGHEPSAAFLKQQAAAFTLRGSPSASSMCRDLRKGAPVEVENILGDFLERGRMHGCRSPLLEAACVNLRIYQLARSRKAPDGAAEAD
jgi:2-dehydropantoate 2-reductase